MERFNNLPRLAPNSDSIAPAHDALNPGPERSQYDVQRHEQFKLRYPKRILTTRNRLPDIRCYKCAKSIVCGGITVDRTHYCAKCYAAS